MIIAFISAIPLENCLLPYVFIGRVNNTQFVLFVQRQRYTNNERCDVSKKPKYMSKSATIILYANRLYNVVVNPTNVSMMKLTTSLLV